MKPSDLLKDESCWTQVCMGRDSTGRETPCRGENAVSWCIFGLVMRAYSGDSEGADEAWEKIKRHVGSDPITWNDDPSRTWTEVRDALLAVGE